MPSLSARRSAQPKAVLEIACRTQSNSGQANSEQSAAIGPARSIPLFSNGTGTPKLHLTPPAALDYLRNTTLWRVRVVLWLPLGEGGKRPPERPVMSDFLSHYLVPLAIVAVAVVLVLGLVNMLRGGS